MLEKNETDGGGGNLHFLRAVGDGGAVGDRRRRGREEEAQPRRRQHRPAPLRLAGK